ncbi:MAG: hypothetical protein QY316_08720 [Thermodesulfobacteriota bacterium]|jgi:hypothetical protein|nr:MAG: hypothetical protein QY316_08720 [Thermodesulfobacteriota bacterium]
MPKQDHRDIIEAPGVFVLALIFLVVFIVIWFVHLKWLTDVWGVQ